MNFGSWHVCARDSSKHFFAKYWLLLFDSWRFPNDVAMFDDWHCKQEVSKVKVVPYSFKSNEKGLVLSYISQFERCYLCIQSEIRVPNFLLLCPLILPPSRSVIAIIVRSARVDQHTKVSMRWPSKWQHDSTCSWFECSSTHSLFSKWISLSLRWYRSK